MNIEYLIEEENRVALESLNAYSDVIRNTENIIALLNQIVYIQNEQATAFYCLNKNSQHGLYQCLLSLLRRHDVQAQLMLRHAMETACLAVYSLHNTSLENYIVNDEFGSKPVKPIKDKAYNWIHKHYPEMSDKLKVAKSLINDFYAHGNLFASLISLTRRNDGVDIIDYFDRKRDVITQTAQIWKVGYIA